MHFYVVSFFLATAVKKASNWRAVFAMLYGYTVLSLTMRKIIHVDMDCFFAAVEMRDNPALRDIPLAIGGSRVQRGVISTANYPARKFGVRSAMPTAMALKLCPHLTLLPGRFDAYKEASIHIREIFSRYTSRIEPLSLDEAYLDVTINKLGIKSAVKIAKLIQYDIWQELHLTCSAGVSYNKFIAKLASDFQKPAGLTVVLPEEAQEFLEKLPIEKFHGVGKKSVERLHDMEIYTGADLLKIPEMTLIDRFGRFGFDLFRKARGISNSPVRPNRVRKSIGSERTYGKLLYNEDDIKAELTKNARRVAESAQKNKKVGRIIVIKVRYSDFSTLTKRMTLDKSTQDFDTIERIAHTIFDQLEENSSGVRLLGVTLTGLENQEGRQLDLDDLESL